MLITGTVPKKDMPLTHGKVKLEDGLLIADGQRFSRIQGTGAMISAALATTNHLKLESPEVLVVGDIGDGKGSRELYQYLIENISDLSPDILVMHYCLPIMALMRQLCNAIAKMERRPFMIADAGAMYAAKGAGLAKEFDLLTPDPSEIAFLADPKATHPAYIAEHLFQCDSSKTPEQIASAFDNNSAAKLLLVKGKKDYIATKGKILATVDQPNIRTLEAIGGTGDTITGLVSAFVYSGLEAYKAAVIAAKTNRMAGKFLQPTPATKVAEIIDQFPAVFQQYLCEWSEICYV
jgi:hypothetical protein